MGQEGASEFPKCFFFGQHKPVLLLGSARRSALRWMRWTPINALPLLGSSARTSMGLGWSYGAARLGPIFRCATFGWFPKFSIRIYIE